MATYGVDRNGTPRNGFIFGTGWTPTIGPNQTTPSFGGGDTHIFVQFNGQSQNDDRIAKQFRKVGPAIKMLRTLFLNQIGNPVGSASGTATYKQVRGQTGDTYSSLRFIDNVGQASRTTTTGDISALRGIISRATAPAVYPVDLSRNGGGGKVRY